jgi:hypothetical protein
MADPAALNIRRPHLYPVKPVHSLKIKIVNKRNATTRINMLTALDQIRLHNNRNKQKLKPETVNQNLKPET